MSLHSGPLNNKSLQIYPGDFFVGDSIATAEDIGALENLVFDTSNATVIEIDSDNREKILTKTKSKGKITFDWKEPSNLRAINNLFKGVFTLYEYDGLTAVPVQGEDLSLSKTSQVQVENKNGDNTALTVTVKDLSGNTLVEGTDYTTSQVNGYTLITLATGYATDTESVKVDYSYTPKKSLQIKPSASGVSKPRMGRCTAPIEQDDGSIAYKTVEFSYATASSPLIFAFTNTDRSNDVGIVPVEIDLGTKWRIVDEYNI